MALGRDHIDDDVVLPPHALNVFVPLVPCDVSNGGTEFVPGTHADWTASSQSYVLDAAPGSTRWLPTGGSGTEA